MTVKRLNRIRLTGEDHAVNSVCLLICLIMAFVCVYPLYYTLINSLNDGKDAARGGIYLWPRVFSLENYKTVVSDQSLPLSFVITALRTFIGTASSLFFTAMVSYALSRKNLIFRRFYIFAGLITMYIGGGVIPTYVLYRQLSLINTFWVYVVPSIYSFGYGILMMNFFIKLPESLIESARIDGASDFKILFRVVLPLSKPMLATMALFIGVGHWNDWFTSAYYVVDEKLMTMPAALMRLLTEADAVARMKEILGVNSAASQMQYTVTADSVRYATLIVSVMPITVLYPFLQRYFIHGMMLGSLKE